MIGSFITRKLAVALGLALVLAGVVVSIVWREASRHARTVAQTTRAGDVFAALDNLITHQADADACRCAFLVRAEGDWADRFQVAAAGIRHELEQLRDLAGDDTASRLCLDEITPLAERKLTLLEQSIQLRRGQRFNDRRQFALSQEMRNLSEALRAPLAALRARADRTISGQVERGWTSASQTGTAVGVGQLLILMVLGVTAMSATREQFVQRRSAVVAQKAQAHAEAHAAEQSSQLSEATIALAELSDLQGRLEEHFRQAQQLASVGRVTSEVIHDFNNLLTVILACSETTLQGLPADDPSREILGQAVKAGYRAAAMTRQVLSASRSKPGTPGPHDLNAAVRDMEPILRRVAGSNVEVAVSLAADLPSVVAGRGQLERVLLNLVANARDAMPQGGKLTIETRPDGLKRALLTVTDTGCGMDGETKARLFEPFFTTKGEGKGTGLGMAIVHEAVRSCGGSVEADSAPGQGTVVRISFCLADVQS
jgi:signal transduction histidine kinase